jgi:hypothetical protein
VPHLGSVFRAETGFIERVEAEQDHRHLVARQVDRIG